MIFENRCNTKDPDARNGSFVDALSLTGWRGSLGRSTERLHEVVWKLCQECKDILHAFSYRMSLSNQSFFLAQLLRSIVRQSVKPRAGQRANIRLA